MPELSRRTLLRGGGVGLFGVASLGVLPLFSTPSGVQDPATCRAPDTSTEDMDLVISNWTGYIDPTGKATNTLPQFEERTGISVTYTADVNDNSEFYAKVKNQLAACDPVQRDLFVLTDWMATKMIDLGWIQPLDGLAVPNLRDNILPALSDVAWDPEREYSAPWQSGLTGIAYNAAEVGEVRTVAELLTRSDLSGRMSLLTEMRDTMGLILLSQGADPADFSPAEWDEALGALQDAKDSGHIRSFNGNDYTGELENGNIVACEAWSGDVIQAQFNNPDIKFVIPEEGCMLWSDNMLVPNKATHQANAEAWINYYYDPMVAAKLASWVNYICPVAGAQKAMEKVDKSLVDNQLIFPDDDTLSQTHGFMPLSERLTRDYEKDFSNVTG